MQSLSIVCKFENYSNAAHALIQQSYWECRGKKIIALRAGSERCDVVSVCGFVVVVINEVKNCNQ